MTQDCSVALSMADENRSYENRCFPKGIHIVGTDDESVLKVGEISRNEKNCVSQSLDNPNVKADEENTTSQAVPPCSDKKAEELPWGYIFIQHMSAGTFERRLETRRLEGGYKPKCFIHRTMHYRKKPNGKGIIKEEKPTVSGLVFLQGKTEQLKSFLKHNFPQYFLVNDCSTGKPAVIADCLMRPFMRIMEESPERVTFLRDPFVKFAKDHVKLRVLTGLFKGQEGYVVRVMRDRQLIMNFGGYAVAINNVHKEDFEVVAPDTVSPGSDT